MKQVKLQEFHGFRVLSTYCEENKVWLSDFCEPYEWNTEREMRRDMLIHELAEDKKEKELFTMWDCRDEIEFFDKYDNYNKTFTQEEYED